MFRLILQIAAFVLFAAHVSAARAEEVSPTHLAAAREVLQLSGILTPFEAVVPQLTEDLKRQSVTRPELANDLNEVVEALKPEMEQQRQEMIDAAARIYAQRMTEEELKQVIAFYKSPVGQKLFRTEVETVDPIAREGAAWVERVSQYVMTRTRAEMAKRGHQLQ